MFGKKRYEELMKLIGSYGFTFSKDWHASPSNKNVLLRHDIDFSIEDALTIAKLENTLEVQSTFFFMLTSNMYNIFSTFSQNLINQIINLNHKVSIHFDPTVYSTLDSFLEEKYFFEKTFDVDIDIVSIHRPGKFLNNNNQSLFEVAHTYQDKFFTKMEYISDSGGVDVKSKLDKYLSNPSEQGLQLLLHPIWWTSKTESPIITLNNCFNKKLDFLTDEAELNCKTYKKV